MGNSAPLDSMGLAQRREYATKMNNTTRTVKKKKARGLSMGKLT